MLCLNCGKEIPVVGNVCPWCGANKQQSTLANTLMYIFMFVGGGIGAFIGNNMNADGGMFIGGFIGGVIGAVIGLFQGSKPVSQGVNCPNCGVHLTINRMEGPNYNCPECGKYFHLQ